MLGPVGLRQLARLVARLSLALLALSAAACSDGPAPASPSTQRATVTKVTDGDTLRLAGLGRVRLIGVDTPEVYGRVECFGREASAFVRRIVPAGSTVRYRLGVEKRDRYGRVLAYVWLRDGRPLRKRPAWPAAHRWRFLNALLVERGYAQPLTIPPNVDYAERFRAAARRARATGRGLWARPGCVTSGR